MPNKLPFTVEGYARLEAELAQQRITEKAALQRLVTAREMGDLSENGAYKYAKLELGNSRRSIRELSQLLKQVSPTPKPAHPTTVVFGCTVQLQPESSTKTQTYTIVSTYEADPLEGRISLESPLGMALANQKLGAVISYSTPQGLKSFTLIGLN